MASSDEIRSTESRPVLIEPRCTTVLTSTLLFSPLCTTNELKRCRVHLSRLGINDNTTVRFLRLDNLYRRLWCLFERGSRDTVYCYQSNAYFDPGRKSFEGTFALLFFFNGSSCRNGGPIRERRAGIRHSETKESSFSVINFDSCFQVN